MTPDVAAELASQAIQHEAFQVAQRFIHAISEHDRPCAIWRPRLSIDEDQWVALYGENLQNGVAGFGPSPREAMHAFDIAWDTKLPPASVRKENTP